MPPALVATSQCSRKVLDFCSMHNSRAHGGPRYNLMGRVVVLRKHIRLGDVGGRRVRRARAVVQLQIVGSGTMLLDVTGRDYVADASCIVKRDEGPNCLAVY